MGLWASTNLKREALSWRSRRSTVWVERSKNYSDFSVYQEAPPESAYIFMVDINKSSFDTKALYYFVAAVKEVLGREELNETQIYFYTYD